MQFLELIEQRYSARSYKPDPVEADKLQQVLEAARLAPTRHNQQPFQLIVIHTANREAELRRIYPGAHFVQAPIVICACGIVAQDFVSRGRQGRRELDVGVVMDHLSLAATSLGLGTCWIGAIDFTAAREVLGLPEGVDPIVFMTLGYTDDPPRPKTRKALTELVRYEHW
ncbi:MAG: nitroreductase family protein [Chloroflexi bacterium]|nr:nitroreductase family protein [Chloroflexota bacterium]MBI3930936.1 nitroreductase family protein [Chloroflexota bacterium]